MIKHDKPTGFQSVPLHFQPYLKPSRWRGTSSPPVSLKHSVERSDRALRLGRGLWCPLQPGQAGCLSEFKW